MPSDYRPDIAKVLEQRLLTLGNLPPDELARELARGWPEPVPAPDAMDGSPARVVKYLESLSTTGKFAPYAVMSAMAGKPPVIDIKFQSGPIGEGVNGCSIEDVIDVLIERLKGFQRGPFWCEQNVQAITNMMVAKMWLMERTTLRQKQGVEGTTKPHLS